MSLFTQSNPGTKLEIRQIHNKSTAVYNKVYYGQASDGTVRQYRGTRDGRLKDETKLIATESDTASNTDRLDLIDKSILELTAEDERLEAVKADKCYVTAASALFG